MSSRWYPLYQKGNPQLRVFLPNFFMKLVRPKPGQSPNVVAFRVSNGMSKHDVKNYLEKIYNIQVANVSTKLAQGDFRQSVKGYVIKDDDFKVAYVTLPKGSTFEFPELYPEKKEKAERKEEEDMLKGIEESFRDAKDRNKFRPDVPTWFTT